MPRDSVKNRKVVSEEEKKKKCPVLTADRSALTEGLCNPGVEIDIQVLLDGQLLVTLLAPQRNPVCERLPDKGIDHVADIAAWHLAYLPHSWQCIGHLLAREAKLQNLV